MKIAIKACGLQKEFPPWWHLLVPKMFKQQMNLNSFRHGLVSASLEVPQGQIHGLLGPNASGKSTLMRVIASSLVLDVGKLWLFGECHNSNCVSVKRQVLRVGVGSMVSLELSAQENARFLLGASGLNPQNRTCVKWFDDFGLDRKSQNTPLKKLSSGKQQVVNLVCGLVLKRPILLLDEPFVHLDTRASKYLTQLLKEQAACGVTVVVTSHIISMLEKLCEAYTVMYSGSTIASGTPATIKKIANCSKDVGIETAFLTLIANVEANVKANRGFETLPINKNTNQKEVQYAF